MMQNRVRKQSKRTQSKAKQPPAEGVIPWKSLTEPQKLKFERNFQADKARIARSKATFGKKDSADVYMASYLETHQALQRKIANLRKCEDDVCRIALATNSNEFRREAETTFKELTATRLGYEEMLRSYRARIQGIMFLWIGGGNWSKLQWLADYGREHAPEGLDSTPSAKFPPPKQKHASESESNSMQMLILGHFLRLSGMDYHDLHFPSYVSLPTPSTTQEWARQKDQPPGRMLPRFLPKSLPTKLCLQTLVTESLNRLHGQKKTAKKSASYFSRTLKALGLAGLPDSRTYRDNKRRAAPKVKPEKLTVEGDELLALMREGIR